MIGAIKRLFGGSQPTRVEYSLVDVVNDCVEQRSMDTTICLSPEIVKGTRLAFNTSSLLKNQLGTAGYNLLGHIRNSIDVSKGECIIIMSITRTHIHNELDAAFEFNMNSVFDDDPATQAVRSKIDAVLSMDGATSVRAQPVKRLTTPKVGTTSRKGDLEVVETGDKHTESLLALDPFQGEENILEQADKITVRGRHVHRNVEESKNIISVGTITANTTSCVPRLLYKASISHNIVKWFAGQDAAIQNPGSYVHKNVSVVSHENMDPVTRALRPVIYYEIYPEDHSLVLFIRMFSDDLDVDDKEIMFLKGDRDGRSQWCQIDKELVARARNMILYVVYAQMYYTTLRDCTFERLVDDSTEISEHALVLKIASQWKLEVDKVTKAVSDWPQGAYRPQVVITLHVEYFVVKKESASAASIHKSRTTLSQQTVKQ